MRAIVVAGVHSGVGKTTVATGLMAAYRRRGLRVQGFKVGPDYIDASYHTAACGRASRTLDGWMLGLDAVSELFAQAAAAADLCV
ncbi:MAG TPA: cobyrinic acid a,c-diamide synthase, partial [Dehalococcoidia bacterium]